MNENKPELQLDTLLIKKGAQAIRALNHPLRQEIMHLVHDNKLIKVTDIYVRLRIEQSVASAHLAILRRISLLNTERVGKNIFYSVNYGKLQEMQEILKRMVASHMA
ncbi:MAG TPA: metalloregulator ArsR/SmtB family transcription factor [Flavisolibacter sp.]|jgi:DNA-binding transcriptional ArsR family regulator|nr:metalloregulator ArsR/SmtB family transcription factor [Flavisolibacter sp.]